MRVARRRGIATVLQLASAHIATQTALLEDEARRSGVGAPGSHARVIARTLREYEEADVLAVPSAFVRRTFVEQGVPVSKIKLVPWGVHPVTSGGAIDRERAPDRTPRILFVGAVGVRKGVPYLLEAFGSLQERAELRLVGPVDARFVRAIGGLPDGVEAAGVKTGDALAAEFRAADIFVLPSVEDGFGVVTTEALAAGLPAIVSENCGSADAVRDGVNGFVVPARDASALRDRIERLLADDELRLRMGAAAASSVRGWWWEESGEAHLREIYAPLVRSHRGSSAKEAALARAS
jgi:glycosyltransferase involved in cell wall biosynthesis